MKSVTPILIWSLLAAIAISGLVTLFSRGPSLVFTSYSQSPQFLLHMEELYSDLGRTVLNPIDSEEAKKKLSVSPQEITAYRTYYGSMPEQVENLHMQYEDRIREAGEKTSVKQALLDERDRKIDDIRKNFEDDAYVKTKILNEKKRQLDVLLNDYTEKKASIDLPVVYELKPVNGGEAVTSGTDTGAFGYQRMFDSKKGYLVIRGRDDAFSSEVNFDDTSDYMDSDVQHGEGVSLSTADVQAMTPATMSYAGMLGIPSEAFQKGGVLYEEVKRYQTHQVVIVTLIVAGLAALISLFTVWKLKFGWFVDFPYTHYYDALKIDSKAAIFVIMVLNTLLFVHDLSIWIEQITNGGIFYSSAYMISAFIKTVLGLALLIFVVGNANVRYQHHSVFEKDVKNSYTKRFVDSVKEVFLNRSVAIQTFVLLIGFFLAGVGFVGSLFAVELMMIYVFCVLFVGLPILFLYMRRMGYLNRIFKATEEMAAGKLNSDIKVIGRSPFAEHAVNLNNLREGVEQSVTSQAKSERLKTELITNVSHDLRTPLTSIITYTDLLKNPDLSAEERSEYVDVLDRKSQRLKTLIEDLFEVSKMSSGTMELYKQRVDLGQLVQQAIGEHAEKMAAIPLDFRVSVPEEPLPAVLDGQRWWRMLDNLIGNALKYSLPGTRVFVTLKEHNGVAELVIKNITAYELNENVDELYDRFKRGDASRHTDGSGLGLAIAQSIVDMHGGSMSIDVDGDLFKVTVRVPVA